MGNVNDSTVFDDDDDDLGLEKRHVPQTVKVRNLPALAFTLVFMYFIMYIYRVIINE